MEPNENTPAPTEDPKPAPPVPDYLTPAALGRYDMETVELVNAHVLEIEAADSAYHKANEETKVLKKQWEAKLEELPKLIKERKEARGKPVQRTLLDHIPEAADVQPIAAAPLSDSPLDNLWRDYPLERLTDRGARATDIGRLADGIIKNGGEARPCLTVGQLADYTANVGGSPGFERRISDFRGLGPAGVERIDNALSDFWRWWNNGGQAEFALERGVANEGAQAGAGEGSAVAGDNGNGGEPASPGGDAPPADEPFIEPAQADASGEFSLGGDDAPQA